MSMYTILACCSLCWKKLGSSWNGLVFSVAPRDMKIQVACKAFWTRAFHVGVSLGQEKELWCWDIHAMTSCFDEIPTRHLSNEVEISTKVDSTDFNYGAKLVFRTKEGRNIPTNTYSLSSIPRHDGGLHTRFATPMIIMFGRSGAGHFLVSPLKPLCLDCTKS